MSIQPILTGFQKILPFWTFSKPLDFPEAFAQERFRKKMEVPDSNNTIVLSQLCWEHWYQFDSGLPERRRGHLFPSWHFVKQRCEQLRSWSPGEVRFPPGSSFIATNGYNSIECWLSIHEWTVTEDCFRLFSRCVYHTRALKNAFRKRYTKWFNGRRFIESRKRADNLLYQRLGAYGAFEWKLRQIVTIVRGSRFSSVPKNNEKRRPINIEPFGNVLVQLSIGQHIRDEIKRIFDYDLDSGQDLHRRLIKNLNYATIDLQNASDSVSLALIDYVMPPKWRQLLEDSRSQMVLSPDGDYVITNKISAMGNGFTFELMTFLLLSLCRNLDARSSVYGDDIVIGYEKTDKLFFALTEAGFVVNKDKSFWHGTFRESCGANYDSRFGYIESYDFKYPHNIHDCVMIFNKCRRLRVHPSFQELYQKLLAIIPKSYRSGPDYVFDGIDSIKLISSGRNGSDSEVRIPPYFVTDESGIRWTDLELLPKRLKDVKLKSDILISDCQLNPRDFFLRISWSFKQAERSPAYRHLRKGLWAKYWMYIYSSRRAKDAIRDTGMWTTKVIRSDGYVNFKLTDRSIPDIHIKR